MGWVMEAKKLWTIKSFLASAIALTVDFRLENDSRRLKTQWSEEDRKIKKHDSSMHNEEQPSWNLWVLNSTLRSSRTLCLHWWIWLEEDSNQNQIYFQTQTWRERQMELNLASNGVSIASLAHRWDSDRFPIQKRSGKCEYEKRNIEYSYFLCPIPFIALQHCTNTSFLFLGGLRDFCEIFVGENEPWQQQQKHEVLITVTDSDKVLISDLK